ncbi:MAG TPA: hypothetical protein VK961_14750, partial [Chthoniobacter sp.]|nr:hypothetical protein [Chthoniobacter sp.]
MTTTTRRSARMFGAVFALTLCVIATYEHLRLRTYEAVGVVGLPWDKSMMFNDVSKRQKPIMEWTMPDFDQVAGKIPKHQQALFMDPYGYDPASGVDAIIVVLMRHMSRRAPFSEAVEISYQHPDPHMALLGATLFVEEAISNYVAREKTKRLMDLGELEIRIEYQKRTIGELAHELDVFKKLKTDSTDSSEVINRAKRLQANIELRDLLEKRITEMRAGPDPSDELRVLNPPTLPHPD